MTRHKHPPARRRRRGFFIQDQVLGILVATILLAAILYAIHGQTRADRALAQKRHAARAAEEALLALQAGQSTASITQDLLARYNARVTLAPVATPTNSPAALAGAAWYSATATVDRTTCTVTGLTTRKMNGGAQ